MIDIKRVKIPVNELKFGMFICELDKPWLESDFMLQGVILEDANLDEIQSTCEYVYIDRTKSIGNQFAAAPKIDVAIKRSSAIRIMAPSEVLSKKKPYIAEDAIGEKISFLDILQEVRDYKAPKNAATSKSAGTIFNVSHVGTETTKPARAAEHLSSQQHSNSHFGGYILSAISGFIGSLFGREKLNPSFKIVFKEPELKYLHSHERIIYERAPSVEEEIAEIHPVFEQSEIVTRDLFDAIAHDRNMDISSVSDSLDNMVESIGRTPDALLWLAKLKKADDLAYNQALNVSITSMAFNSFLALSKEEIKTSGLAGLLQDVGKVKLSSDVLSKRDKLTEEEYEYVQRHVDESILILRDTVGISREVIQLVASHHERVDGSGYPFNTKGERLSLLSQSAGLIDTYCAMTSQRTYAKAKSHQEALNEIHALSGKKFSTEIFDQFTQFMGIYPVSSLVELNTGEVGVVIQQNQVRRLMPRVMLLLDDQKQRYSAPIVLDLIYKPITPSGDIYTIVKGIPADSYGLNASEFYV